MVVLGKFYRTVREKKIDLTDYSNWILSLFILITTIICSINQSLFSVSTKIYSLMAQSECAVKPHEPGN